MPKTYPAESGKKAWICRNCGNDPIIERDTEFTNARCPRCGETTFIKPRPRGPP